MNIIKELQKELESEYGITKKFVDRYPEDKNDWKPHNRSMTMIALVTHLIDVFSWPEIIMNTDYLDFEKNPYAPPKLRTRAQIQQKLEADYKKGAAALRDLTPDKFDGQWDIRQGNAIFQAWSKYGALRHSFQQITHHRAQLGVYYRLNDIPLPPSYGPSADEH